MAVDSSQAPTTTLARPGNLAVLGATGTIGEQTLEVVRQHQDKFRIITLSAKKNASRLIALAREFKPQLVAIEDEAAGAVVEQELSGSCRVVVGTSAIIAAAIHPQVQTVVAAVVGFAGCEAVLAAIEAQKHVALANKETLVAAGELVLSALAGSSSVLVPVDSEHSSLFQALRGNPHGVSRLVLTASGGPFYFADSDTLTNATPAMALNHPTWNMGQKISIDSATMMNKGLEVIEAKWLFESSTREIDVLVHPQSLVHGLVEFNDGTSILVAAQADMKLPIAYALGYLWSEDPQKHPGPRLAAGLSRCDLAQIGELKFFSLDHERFPAVKLCTEAFARGGTAGAILNAANEEFVAAFLQEKIAFSQIVRGVEAVLARASVRSIRSFADIREADKWARQTCELLTKSAA